MSNVVILSVILTNVFFLLYAVMLSAVFQNAVMLSEVLQNAVMLSVIMLNVIVLSAVMLNVFFAECH